MPPTLRMIRFSPSIACCYSGCWCLAPALNHFHNSWQSICSAGGGGYFSCLGGQQRRPASHFHSGGRMISNFRHAQKTKPPQLNQVDKGSLTFFLLTTPTGCTESHLQGVRSFSFRAWFTHFCWFFLRLTFDTSRHPPLVMMTFLEKLHEFYYEAHFLLPFVCAGSGLGVGIKIWCGGSRKSPHRRLRMKISEQISGKRKNSKRCLSEFIAEKRGREEHTCSGNLSTGDEFLEELQKFSALEGVANLSYKNNIVVSPRCLFQSL